MDKNDKTIQITDEKRGIANLKRWILNTGMEEGQKSILMDIYTKKEIEEIMKYQWSRLSPVAKKYFIEHKEPGERQSKEVCDLKCFNYFFECQDENCPGMDTCADVSIFHMECGTIMAESLKEDGFVEYTDEIGKEIDVTSRRSTFHVADKKQED